VLLRYVSGPVLFIVLSFAVPEFHEERYDPLMILGFIVAILGMVIIIAGFVMPRYYDIFIPPHRRGEGTEETVALVTKGDTPAARIMDESGELGGDSESNEEKGGDYEKTKGVSDGQLHV
jgi:solute carrier family 6 (neurotransmitter transporter, GABA) member 1